MISKVGKYEFLAEPFHCDMEGRLFMGHLGNHLINAADFHSNDRGFGMTYLMPRKLAWVLSRLVIEMDEMPQAYDRFTVETWVESAMRFFTNRNFRITNVADNRVIGYGKSVWAMINTETRQPVDLLKVRDGELLNYVETEENCPIARPSRVTMSAEAQEVETISTHYCDVDMNGHINSIKYIEHVLDLWSLDFYRAHSIKRFEIAYVAETHCGDKLSFLREETAPNEYCVRIMKLPADGSVAQESCRCKVIFVEK